MPKVWFRIKLFRIQWGQRGFSPVEVLLAATVFGFLVTALIGAIIYGRSSTANAGERARAVQLADEGIEAVRNIRDAGFTNLVNSASSTVGNTNIETGSDFNSGGTNAYKVTTSATGGAVSSISVYIKTIDSVNSHVQAAIYADSGGAPGARLGASVIQTAIANSWNVFSISGVTASPSTSYWLALSEDGNTQFANGGGGTSAYHLTGGYPAPATFTSNVTGVEKPSFYMNIGGTYGLVQSGNQWTLSGTSDVVGIFTRQITISDVDATRKTVTATVTWPQGTGTASVTTTSRLTNWIATIVPPPPTTGPLMMVYSKTTTTPFYRTWNGTTWSAEAPAVNVVGNINYVVVKSSRTRNEAVMGVQTSTGAIYVQVWNGTSWGNLTQVGTGPTTMRSFDIAYEKSGDRALIAFTPVSGSPDFAYRTWNGTTLSAATTITAPPTTGVLNWLELRQNPLSASNDIAMIMLDANADVYGMMWTGTAWSTMGTAVVWDATAASATKKTIDVEYEQTSGKAMFMWGDSIATDQYYRTWNGTTLTAATLLDIATEGGVPEWIQLVARPNSNEIMVGVQDAAANLNTRKWSGSAWDTATQHPEHSALVENITSRVFDIIYETNATNAGKAWLMWGDGATITTKQWSGSAWGTGAVLASSDDTSFIRLRADPTSGAVFAGIYEDSTSATKNIWETRLTGGSAAWTAKNTIWSGPTGTTPVFFRMDISTP